MIRLSPYIESIIESIIFPSSFCVTRITPKNTWDTARLFSHFESQISKRSVAIRSTAAILIAFFLLPAAGFAQAEPSSAGGAPTAGAALPPDVLELRREGMEAMYNFDYAAAHAKYEEIRKRLPQHPAGDLYLATLIWLQHLSKSRRLQTGLYNNKSNFYAGAENAKEDSEGDVVDASVDRAFRDRMAQAKTKALALVAKNKGDADALYFLGSYYGVMAGYEASSARKFTAAMRNGSRCVDAHQKVLKLKPDYYDAYLSVGMYDYIVGNLPFGYKALGAIAGIRGNKQRGITRLQTMIEKNASNADDARVLLLAVYQNEKRYNDALALLQQLTAKYPNSYLLKLETATILIKLDRADEAYKMFESLLKDPAASAVIDLVHYQYAEALAHNKEYQRAAEHFLAVPQAAGANANLTTLALLRAAQFLDLAGQRNEAIAQYKTVLTRPNVYDTRAQAEKGLKQPFVVKEKKGA